MRFPREYAVEVSMPQRQFPSLLENDVFIDVFANPRRTGILKNFLNAVFAAEDVSLISSLRLSPRENNRLDPTGKLTIDLSRSPHRDDGIAKVGRCDYA